MFRVSIIVIAMVSTAVAFGLNEYLPEGVDTAQAAFPGANGKIAFASNRDGNFEIYTMDPDGSNQVRLTNVAASDETPVWSADGSKLAFASNRDGNPEIYIMNSNGSGQLRLTTDPSLDRWPAWSPDGTKIAFTSKRADGVGDIYVMNADGTGQTQLTTSSALDYLPAWSPDGSTIVFASTRDGSYEEIYTMNANGSGQTRVTNNGEDELSPDWSPDGNKLTFHRFFFLGDYEIFSMNADGTCPVQLTSNSSLDAGASWSPNGGNLAFLSDRDGNFEIYSMSSDGSAQTRLTNNAAHDSSPDWQPIPGSSSVMPSTCATPSPSPSPSPSPIPTPFIGNTPTSASQGFQPVVVPINGGHNQPGGASVTFEFVTGGGTTTLIPATGPPPPPNFKVVGPPDSFYEIHTDATFIGNVTICINYTALITGPESAIQMWHYTAGTWVNLGGSVFPTPNYVCASTTSFSVFALLVADPVGGLVELPVPGLDSKGPGDAVALAALAIGVVTLGGFSLRRRRSH